MIQNKELLVIIPARGGSKGLPGKNIKHLNGKPLIYYSIDIARLLVSDLDICVSTDSIEIAQCVERYNLPVPFLRPAELATDLATTNDVLIHAIEYYKSKGVNYNVILLLQPTSPLRRIEQVQAALALYSNEIDMVISVKESHASSVICKEDENGFLFSIINKGGVPRQLVSRYYEYNGAIYIINAKSLLEKGMSNLNKRIKYVMPEADSYDIDTPCDWLIVETMIKKR